MFERLYSRKYHFSKIAKLGVVRLFISLALAAFYTIWSIYLFSFLKSESGVGFFTGFFRDNLGDRVN